MKIVDHTNQEVIWGIMGSGAIVDRWMKGAVQCKDMKIAAIASRTVAHAEKKAQEYQIPMATDYEHLVCMQEIQVVYIAAVHTAHKQLAILAMEHGKSVLVEKPATVSEAELQEMLACARKNHVFFMEAVWTRFLPAIQRMKEEILKGTIGKVRDLQTSFSFRVPADQKEGRLLNPNQAGGGLLDVGIYNLHFANEVYQKNPVRLIGLATVDSDENHFGVDEQASYIAQYEDGALATMTSGVRTDMKDSAYIFGTGGYMEIPSFWKASELTIGIYPDGIRKEDTIIYRLECPIEQCVPDVTDEGFQYEIRHVNDCVCKGLAESPVMSWEKSIEILRECDRLRSQWGLRYPFEAL